jgi:hypothetical protein
MNTLTVLLVNMEDLSVMLCRHVSICVISYALSQIDSCGWMFRIT